MNFFEFRRGTRLADALSFLLLSFPFNIYFCGSVFIFCHRLFWGFSVFYVVHQIHSTLIDIRLKIFQCLRKIFHEFPNELFGWLLVLIEIFIGKNLIFVKKNVFLLYFIKILYNLCNTPSFWVDKMPLSLKNRIVDSCQLHILNHFCKYWVILRESISMNELIDIIPVIKSDLIPFI